MSETPKQWAKRMWEMGQKTPQFCLQAFINRYEERGKDYGAFTAYGPFTDEELDEYDIAHCVRTSIAEVPWIFAFDLNSTHEENMASFERFIEEQRPEEYKKYKYKGVKV